MERQQSARAPTVTLVANSRSLVQRIWVKQTINRRSAAVVMKTASSSQLAALLPLEVYSKCMRDVALEGRHATS